VNYRSGSNSSGRQAVGGCPIIALTGRQMST
jgi:hypothetical protein